MRCQQPSRELPMRSGCRLPSCVLAFALAWLAGACLPDDGPYGVQGTGGNTGTGGGGGGAAGSAGGNVGSGGIQRQRDRLGRRERVCGDGGLRPEQGARPE